MLSRPVLHLFDAHPAVELYVNSQRTCALACLPCCNFQVFRCRRPCSVPERTLLFVSAANYRWPIPQRITVC